MEIPDKLLYSTHHFWLFQESDSIVYIGLTPYILDVVGSLLGVDLPYVGRTFYLGESCGTLDGDIAAIKIYFPVNGSVLEVHQPVIRNPHYIHQRPYSMGAMGGWLLKVQCKLPANFMNAEQYKDFVETAKPFDWV